MALTFNEAELLQRVDHDKQFLAETVQMLTSDGPPLVEQIRHAMVAGDAPAVARHAHALKGMIANFSAPETVACALEVEMIGRGGDLRSALLTVKVLQQRLDALTAELIQFVKVTT